MRKTWTVRIVIAGLIATAWLTGYWFSSHGAARGRRVDVTLSAPAWAQWSNGSDPCKTTLVEAAEKVLPSVVSVGAERTTVVATDPFANDFFMPFFGHHPRLYRRFRQKLPYLGSGVILTKEGHIITNQHVVDQADRVFVTLMDGTEYEAALLEEDPINDLALLKIDAEDLHPAPMGDSESLHLAEPVLAIGNPYGNVLGDPSPTVTVGVVSALNRYYRPSDQTSRLYEGMIQTDAPINPGNSGGALVDARGEVIGINTFIFTQTGGSIGIGFAIPISRVRYLLDEVLEHGALRKPHIDFALTPLTPYVRQALAIQANYGAVIANVAAGGPAEQAGLEPGDVVMAVDGRRVETPRELAVRLLARPVGDEVVLSIERRGKTIERRYRLTGPAE